MYVNNAIVAYHLPVTPKGHYKQSIRFLTAKESMKTYFGEELVNNELSLPFRVYVKSIFKFLPILIIHPIHSLVYILTSLLTVTGKVLKIKPRELWIVQSSKSDAI
jgi:hypothetical protein